MKHLFTTSKRLLVIIGMILVFAFILANIGFHKYRLDNLAYRESELVKISELQNSHIKTRYFTHWERVAQSANLGTDSLIHNTPLEHVAILSITGKNMRPLHVQAKDSMLLRSIEQVANQQLWLQRKEILRHNRVWAETINGNQYLCLARKATMDGEASSCLILFTLPVDALMSFVTAGSNQIYQTALLLPDTAIYGTASNACLDNEIDFASMKSETKGFFVCQQEDTEVEYAWAKQTLFGNIEMLYILGAPVHRKSAAAYFGFAILILGIGALFVPLYYKRKYARQIAILNTSVNQIREKDFDVTIPLGLSDELGELALSIDGMRMNLKEIYQDLEIRVIRRTSEISMRNAELRKTHRDILKQNTELQSAYDALKESREKYEKLIEHLENEYFFYSKAADGSLLFVSTSIQKILGYEAKEYRSKHDAIYTQNALNDEARKQQAAIAKESAPVSYLAEMVDAEGAEKILEIIEVPVFNDADILVSIEGMARDITEKQKNEELIKEQEERYRMLFDHASDFIFLYDLNTNNDQVGKFLEANQYTLNRLGYTIEELRELTPLDLIAVDIWTSDIHSLEEFTRSEEKFERIWESKEGKIINLEISTHVFNIKHRDVVIAVARDITDRKRAEEEIRFVNEELINQKENLEALVDNLTQTQEQLVQSEKMAALGQLIAGIAHEINTPLGAIKASIGNLSDSLDTALKELPELTQNQSPQDLKVFSELFEIALQQKGELSSREKRQKRRENTKVLKEQEIAEADLLADTLVYLSIFQEDLEKLLPQFKELDNPLKVVRSARNFISLMKNSGTINIAVEKATKVVFALKKFAHRDAMGEKVSTDIIDGIETVLTLYNNQLKQGIEIERNYDELPLVKCYKDEISQVWTNLLQNAIQAMRLEGTLAISAKLEGEYVTVQFKDSGPGIEPDIRERIFEPFFTTKKVGEGSGLGLDIVKKIVEKHDGMIWLESELGKGATFNVKIPLE